MTAPGVCYLAALAVPFVVAALALCWMLLEDTRYRWKRGHRCTF